MLRGSLGGSLRVWSLRVHRHLGLFLAPALVLFCVSSIVLNHPGEKPAVTGPQARTVAGLDVPDLDGLALARSLASQAGIEGEVDWIQRRPEQEEILVMMSKPTRRTEIRVDLRTRQAQVLTRNVSALDRLLYLHKRPGPHVASIRGNWWVLKIWRYVADWSVLGAVLLLITGIYLWLQLPGERKAGILFLASGILVLNLLFLLMLR